MVDITTTACSPSSVNQRFPSGPATIPCGSEPEGKENSVTVPDGVIMPILETGLPVPGTEYSASVNQTFPSGPTVMPGMTASSYPTSHARPGTTNSLIVPEAVIWPIARLTSSAHHNVPSDVAVISFAATI